jgi:hypothetical protein
MTEPLVLTLKLKAGALLFGRACVAGLACVSGFGLRCRSFFALLRVGLFYRRVVLLSTFLDSRHVFGAGLLVFCLCQRGR